jgi:outer membrane protein OmpA-like peptidoglycan-associated protein
MSSTDPNRDRVEELLARAERVARQPVPQRATFTRLRWPLIGVGTIVAIVVVAAIASNGDSSGVPGQTTAVPLASTTSVVATTTPIVITLPPNPTNTTTATTTTTTTTATTTTATAPTTTTPATPRTTAFGLPARTITYQGGTLVLQGEVADQATADAIRQALAESFGSAAIVDQLRIVGDAPLTDEDPLAAGTAVRFPAGQPTTDVASLRFLDQIADLLGRHPGVTADLHVSADAAGDALARQRAGAVRQYLAGRGVAAERLTTSGDPNTGQTAQLVVIFHHLPG